MSYFFTHRERHAKHHWGYSAPPEKRLTNEAVTEFVQCLQPIILNSMYCKVGIAEMGVILQNLATLRPEIVCPPLVERLYMALETLTEPHKLTATLHAVVSVSRFVEMKLINPCCTLIGAESSHWLDLAHSSSFTTYGRYETLSSTRTPSIPRPIVFSYIDFQIPYYHLTNT